MNLDRDVKPADVSRPYRADAIVKSRRVLYIFPVNTVGDAYELWSSLAMTVKTPQPRERRVIDAHAFY